MNRTHGNAYLSSVTDERINNTSIEHAIAQLEVEKSQKNIWKLLQTFETGIRCDGSLFVPVIHEGPEDMFEVERLSFETTHLAGSVRTVSLERGGKAYCAFTSREEMEKGQPTSWELMPMAQCLSEAMMDEEVIGLLINPWGLSVLLDKKLLMLILSGEQDGDAEFSTASKSSIFIDMGETADQKADAIVNAALHPFLFETPGGQRILDLAGSQLLEECPVNEEPGEMQVLISRAGNLDASMIVHASLPEHATEKNLVTLINRILEKASLHGAHSIAIPAIGSEEGDLQLPIPLAVIAAAGWLSEHPDAELDVTIVCRTREVYQLYRKYLVEE